MTREEIEALCAIAEQHDKAATRGPWEYDDGDLIPDVARESFGSDRGWKYDGRFIAAARAGWPALAKAARELLAENERLRRRAPNIDEWLGPEEPGVG